MQYIARISYGKDSLKMLDVIHSRHLPLDRITTTDVWATDTIPANLPPMQAFKDRIDQRIWDMYRIEVEHMCACNPDGSKRTYEQMFYHVPKRRSQTGRVERGSYRTPFVASPISSTNGVCQHSNVTIKGFPGNTVVKWCQQLKIRNLRKDIGITEPFQKSPTTGDDRNIVQYIGIAADEPKRFAQLNGKKRAPLVEFGIDEGLCGLYCQYSDMLSPSYETSCRDGCWFCHNQGVSQLRILRKGYPDLWQLLMQWDLDSPVTFHADGHTVHDFDRRFALEDDGFILPEERFMWSMINDELNYRWF